MVLVGLGESSRTSGLGLGFWNRGSRVLPRGPRTSAVTGLSWGRSWIHGCQSFSKVFRKCALVATCGRAVVGLGLGPLVLGPGYRIDLPDFRIVRWTQPPLWSDSFSDLGFQDVGFWIWDFRMQPIEEAVCEQLLAEAQRILLSGALAADVVSSPAVALAAPGDGQVSAANAMLAPVYNEAARLGLPLLPLRSPADVLKVAEAELLYPVGVPFRTRKMLDELHDRHVHLGQSTSSSGWCSGLRRWTSGPRCYHG